MWFKKKERFADMGKTKKSTNSMIDNAVNRQNSWMTRRSIIATNILRSLNIFAKPSKKSSNKKVIKKVKAVKNNTPKAEKKTHWLLSYWFPIVCALAVIIMLGYVLIVPRCFVDNKNTQSVPEPTIQPIVTDVQKTTADAKNNNPAFDMVRIDRAGKILIAGRWLPNHGVSIKINGKMVATEKTNENGEFVYAPIKEFAAGNYTIRLSGVEQAIDSKDDVFVYVSERGGENSMSLLMTKDGSKFLQQPKLQNGDLAVTKIDYLENERLVVQGNAIPRTRVTMVLDDKLIGMAHVSDHNNFGLGAYVGKLNPDCEYSLHIKMHDGSGETVAVVKYQFIMPHIKPGSDTWYVVRRDDSLWIIARNFLGRGIRYTMIVKENNIKNPDLIFPKQKFKIPVKK